MSNFYRHLLLSGLLGSLPLAATAQTGLGTTTPDASTRLDIVANNRGIRLPQINLASVTDGTTIALPATSLMVWNTNAALPNGTGYYYNSGTPASPNWVKLVDSSTGVIGADNGLNKVGSTVKLGGNLTAATTVTNNGNALNFAGSGTTTTITSAGSVGIGTTSPAQRLHVAGTSGTANVRLGSLSGTGVRMVTADANGDLNTNTTGAANGLFWGILGNSGTNPTTNFVGTTDNQSLAFRTNNVEGMRLTTGNFLGINTTAPSLGRIHVYDNTGLGAAEDNITIEAASGGAPSFVTYAANTNGTANAILNQQIGSFDFRARIAGSYQASTLIGGLYMGDGTTNKSALRFLTSAVEQMRIDENGRLGIGTTSPAQRLHVAGTSGTPNVRFSSLSGTGVRIVTADANGDLSTNTTGAANGMFWGLTGNSGTNSATNFLGTTTAQDLVIRINNTEMARFNSLAPGGQLLLGNNTHNTYLTSVMGTSKIPDTGQYSRLYLLSEGGQSDMTMMTTQASNNGIPQINMGTQGGTTFSSPVALPDGSSLGRIKFWGYNGTISDDALQIEAINSKTTSGNVVSDLMFKSGDTDPERILRMNATREIVMYGYPNTRNDATTAVNFLYTDATGIIQSKPITTLATGGAVTTANNGLTKTGSNVQLGGNLTQVTTVTNNGFDLNLAGSATTTTFTSAGSVGIGTTSPAQRLHVAGTSGTPNVRLGSLSGTGVRMVTADANGDLNTNTTGAANGLFWGLTGNSGTNPSTNFVGTTDNQDLAFRTNNTEKVRFTAAGYVGVGTSTPLNRIHIVSATSDGLGDNDFLYDSYTGTSVFSTAFNIRHARGTLAAPANLQLNDELLSISASGRINGAFQSLSQINMNYVGNGTTALSTMDLLTSGTLRMRLDENGNVGINNNTPAAVLDVNGTAKIGSNGTVFNGILRGTGTLGASVSVPANSTTTSTFTITNAVVGGTVSVSPSANLPTGIAIAFVRVSAANTVTIGFLNSTSGSVSVPTSTTFATTIIQ